jgi:fido (protein-threonine AMPylation protein)
MRNLPWYEKHSEYKAILLKNIEAYKSLDITDKRFENAVKSFRNYQIIKVIYESNLIEKSGVKTIGETREIINEYLPKLPDNISELTKIENCTDLYDLIDFEKIVKYVNANPDNSATSNLMLSIQFGGKSRGAKEVIQHLGSLIDAEQRAEMYRLKKALFGLTNDEKYKPFPLFEEGFIKELHKNVAEDLLPSNCITVAGEYRQIDVTVDDDNIKFPSYDLLNDCMASFVKESNILFEENKANDEAILWMAAKISYNFVRIHPFPDFNGRLSRIILNMVLRGTSFPFYIDINGRSKSRHKYITALKKANNGNLRPYETLIIERANEIFKMFFDELRMSGINIG